MIHAELTAAVVTMVASVVGAPPQAMAVATGAMEELFDTVPLIAPVAGGVMGVEAPTPASTVDLDPSRATAVKFVNPWAAITCATLNPSALNGVVTELADRAFSTSEPPTAGSTSGTTPRSSALFGRVGSEQIDGIETAKGLKFCSAATRPRAAATARSLVPN